MNRSIQLNSYLISRDNIAGGLPKLGLCVESNQEFNKGHFSGDKRKTKVIDGADYKSVSQSRGQPVDITRWQVPRHWAQSIFCSLNVSGDVIRRSSELFE